MGQLKCINAIEARKLISQDSLVTDFLRYLGMFRRELEGYLTSRNLELRSEYTRLLPHRNVDGIIEELGYGQGGGGVSIRRLNKLCPGGRIYYLPCFSRFDGYPRIFYEILDSNINSEIVKILRKLQKDKITFNPKTRRLFYYRHINRLLSLGLISSDGECLELTEDSRRMLSPKVEETWNILKNQSYRIDVW